MIEGKEKRKRGGEERRIRSKNRLGSTARTAAATKKRFDQIEHTTWKVPGGVFCEGTRLPIDLSLSFELATGSYLYRRARARAHTRMCAPGSTVSPTRITSQNPAKSDGGEG